MRTLSLLTVILLMAISTKSLAQGADGGSVLIEKTDLAKSITLYPNPAIEFIDINLSILQAGNVQLTLHNIIGNEIPIESEILEEHKIRVRVKDLATGYYLLAVRDEQSKFRGTYKFIKR